MNNRKKELLSYLSLDTDDETIERYEELCYLTENEGRDGQNYYWWFDEGMNACINVETGEILDAKNAKEDKNRIDDLFL